MYITRFDFHFCIESVFSCKYELITFILVCNKSITSNKASLVSPHYPSEYSADLNCVYTLVASYSSYVVELSFIEFDVEDDPSCEKDYVQFFDGQSPDSSLLYRDNGKQGRFCGSSLPPVTVSSGRTLTVTFHSNGGVNANKNTGFLADWTAINSPPKGNA